MAETQQTTCGHNGAGQVLKAGVMTPCRQCGTLLEPSTVVAGTGKTSVSASYPGNNDAPHKTFVFTH